MRYEKLLGLIDLFRPEKIVEIGVWNGNTALNLIKTAQEHSDFVTYIGYDLFEDATDETDEREFNVKSHATYDEVLSRLLETGANITLIKGDTNETLKPVLADIVFIDGGHSIETIRADYEKVRKSSVIVFDDYYTPDENGEMPDISRMGCNRIVEELPHAVIESNDRVKSGGIVNLAVVFGG